MMAFGGSPNTSAPDTGGPDYRALIAHYLSQAAMDSGSIPGGGPQYQLDEAPPSDPVMGDRTMGDIVGNIQSPAISNPNTALGFLLGDYDAAINAPTPSNVIDSITVSPPDQVAQPAQIDDQGNPAPIDFSTPTNTPAPPSNIIAEPGLFQQGLLENGALMNNETGFAINAGLEDVGTLSTSVNDAVDAAMSSQQGFGAINAGYTSDPGGFGTGTGFSSAAAANDAVGAALGAAIDAASPGGYDSGPGSEGGGGAGGDGAK